jgi:outer membrane protein OmpA-like peptidoglycan-associated protein
MDTDYGMTAESYQSYNKWHCILALILAALLLLLPWVFGIGPSSWRECLHRDSSLAEAPKVSIPAPAAAMQAASPTAATAPEPQKIAAAEQIPSARVFFALNKHGLPRDVDQTLQDVVAYLKSHPSAKAELSGFHDPQGRVSLRYNQALAHHRARRVRDRLHRVGIALNRIELLKPQQSTGTGSNDEARRVEVNIRP